MKHECTTDVRWNDTNDLLLLCFSWCTRQPSRQL